MEKQADDQKAIEVISNNTGKALAAAQALKIEVPEDMNVAAELLTKINRAGDMLKDKKDSLLKPLNDHIKNLRSWFAPAEKQFAEAKEIVTFKLVEFKEKQDRKVKEEQLKIEKKVLTGKMSVATAIKKTEALPESKKTVQSETGAVTFRTDKKVVIFDPALVPCSYHVVDEAAVKKAALGGTEIPGVRIDLVQTPVNSR